ncbi:MAG: GNAT family N-acetyltransferase [Armatimonadota bacterium]
MELKPAQRTDAEYAAMAAIWNAQYPHYPETAAEYADWDGRRSDRFPHHRLILWEGGEIIGYTTFLQSHWCYDPKRFHFTIQVAKPHRRKGHGTRCLLHIISQVKPLGIETLMTDAVEDHDESQAFLLKQGFTLAQRNPVSELRLEGYDLSRHKAKLDGALAQGIRFVTAEELVAKEPEMLKRLHQLSCELEADTPQPGEYQPPSFEDWMRMRWESPMTLRDSWIIAMDGDNPAGFTLYSARGEDGKRLSVEMTGTARGYRRRGIASALKYKAIEYAMARGAEVVVTDNEESNPMFSINLAFGFEAKPAWASYEKRIAE